MSELKLHLPRFDGKPSSDFTLWQIRLQAILESKSLWHVFESTTSSPSEASSATHPTTQSPTSTIFVIQPTEDEKRKATAIIINGIGDKPLRVVAGYMSDPKLMLQKLRERYASSNLSTRMSLMAELQALRYKSSDMSDYVDRYAAILDRLESMDSKVPPELAIIMFMHSMNGKYEATIAALRTLGDEKLTWEDVTTRLIEEYNTNTHKGSASTGNNATALATLKSSPTLICSQCGKPGHESANCWWNPNNPRNKLGKGGKVGGAKQRANNANTNQITENSNKESHLTQRRRQKSKVSKSRDDKILMLNVSSHENASRNEFLLDSGASSHMSCEPGWMHNLHPIPSREIRLADNSIIQAHAAGDLILEAHHNNNSVQKVTVKDVLLVPKLGLNLLSCSRLAEKGVTSVFDKNGCALIDTQNNNNILARAKLRDNLYWVSNMVATLVAENATTVSNKTMPDDVTMWHNRLAHVNRNKISDMIRDKQLPPDAKLDVEKCTDCSSGKQARDSFQGRIDKAVKKGDIIHSDVVGPLPQSVSGARYFVTFIDEFTRFVTATPIKTKSMVLESFKGFQIMFEKQFECTIKCVHSDNGGEYTPVEKFAKQAGIAVTRSAPYTPQSNGVAERMNRTLIESVRTTLLQSGLPKSFWAEALANAIAVKNRIPRDDGKSAYEALTGTKPHIERFKPFGCLSIVHLHESKRRKLDAKTISCVLLRTLDHKTYRMLNMTTQKIVIARHVTFDETKFPARARRNEDNESDSGASTDQSSEISISDEEVYGESSSDDSQAHSSGHYETPDEIAQQSGEDSNHDEDAESDGDEGSSESGRRVVRRYPTRARRAPSNWWTSSANATATVCHGEPVSMQHKSCHTIQDIESDSPTLKIALASPQRELWVEAISEELHSLDLAHTWDMVPRAPAGARVFPSKFVLKVKRTSDGTVERYKARLVLLGHLQRENIDYFETYAPVVDFTAVRIALVLASFKNMSIHHLDVKCAFLNGELQEEIYMRLPDSYAPSDGSVCMLKRSIYGLRQAPRAWHTKLATDLATLGYTSFQHAESIFWRDKDNIKVFLLIYVDDILLLVSSHDAVKSVKEEIASLYTIKDLGEAKYFLGIKLDRNSNGTLRLSQTNYIENILERFNMTASKAVSSPMVPNKNMMEHKPRSKEDASTMTSVPYREAIGALLYLSIRTRPDIAVAVGTLAKHVQEPHPLHWEGVKRILRYLQGTKDKALVFRTEERTNPLVLTVYADADWGTDPNERYSRTGIVCQLGANTVWWKSRKQNSIAVSSCEAEYMALFEGSKDIVWLRNLLCEFGMCQGHIPTLMYSDNQGSIAWATENSLRKVKHIDLRYHFTNMLISSGQIRVKYIESASNLADMLTKSLVGTVFEKANLMLGLSD